MTSGSRRSTGSSRSCGAGYDDLFLQLSEYADQVALVRDVPKSPDDPADCLSSGSPSLGDCMFEPVERSTVLGDVAVDSALASGIEVVDPTPWLCYQGECPIVIGGTLSYRDTDHITTEYAANLWGELGNGRCSDARPAGATHGRPGVTRRRRTG